MAEKTSLIEMWLQYVPSSAVLVLAGVGLAVIGAKVFSYVRVLLSVFVLSGRSVSVSSQASDSSTERLAAA